MRNMINLLPASYRRQQMIRKRALQWCAVTAGVLIAGWALHWYELREHQELMRRLEVLQREHLPTQNMLRQLVDMRQSLVELQQQEAIAKELEGQRTALTLLGVISQTSQKSNGRLHVTKMELTNFQSVHDPKVADASRTEPSSLLLTGVSLDYPAVTELVFSLETSGIFRLVELSSMTEREDNNASLHDYEVRCEF